VCLLELLNCRATTISLGISKEKELEEVVTFEDAVIEMQELLEAQEAARKQIKDNLIITDMGKNATDDLEITTRYGDHWHKIVMTAAAELTGKKLMILLDNSAFAHERSSVAGKERWARMQELNGMMEALTA
jgi:hypothetical protein